MSLIMFLCNLSLFIFVLFNIKDVAIYYTTIVSQIMCLVIQFEKNDQTNHNYV